MGRLPFGIAGEFAAVVHVGRRDKFDHRRPDRLTWLEPADHEPKPAPSFRQGGLSNYRVDPYAR